MKEIPIIFSAPMVRAILAGKKHQTRRLVKPDGVLVDGGGQPFTQRWDGSEQVNWRRDVRCPYGVAGDKLWVRETWRHQASPHTVSSCRYRVDETPENDHYQWRPSIFMPRWASRITLEVTSVRAERLQEISEADAAAEGIAHVPPDSRLVPLYAQLWDSLNAKRAPWASNPWVFVVSFQRLP